MIGVRKGHNAGTAGKIIVVFPEMNLDYDFIMLLKWFWKRPLILF